MTPTRRLRIATGHGAPGLFHDEADLIDLLAEHGIEATVEDWKALEPEGTPILVRTTWDYTEHRERFAAWLDAIESTGTPCFNPPSVMRWNLDKRYLLELAKAGHDVVPSHTLDRFDGDAAMSVALHAGWERWIAKPCIGAGASGLVMGDGGAWRTFDTSGNSWAPGGGAVAAGPYLVQPYLESIQAGEWSLFFFAGQYSHAILKMPGEQDIRVQEEHGGRTQAAEPSPDVRARAAALAAAVPEASIVRVDGVVHEGRFLLMELECIEPELYFRYAPGSLPRFAQTLASILLQDAA